MQVDVVEDFLGAQVHLLHRLALEDKLCGLANKEFTNGHELLLGETLLPVVDLTGHVGKTGNLEQLAVMFNIR